MVELRVFISCGDEVVIYRDLAVRVLEVLEGSLVYGLGFAVVIRNWDYRDEPPEVVPRGRFSARSLQMVESSPVVVGILGATVPPVTSEELLHAIGRVAAGRAENVHLFLLAGVRGSAHDAFLAQILRQTEMQVVYQEFQNGEDLVLKLFRALNPYVIRKAILERQTPVEATGDAA